MTYTYTESEQGDVQAAVRAGRDQTQQFDIIEAAEDEPGLVALVHPADSMLERFDLEPYAATPRRAHGNVTLRRVEDFIAYVDRHEDDNTVVFADATGGMRAVFNHHYRGAPGWRDFTATLARERTKAWTAWMKAAQGPMSQVDFANFLEERLGEIVEPAGADLLDAAEHFRAHTIISFRSQNKLANGQRQIEYIEQVEGGSEQQGRLTLPERLTVLLQPFRDSDAFTVEARLRWRIQDRQVRFSVLFDDTLDERVEEIVDAARSEVDGFVDAPVLRGTDG